MGKERLVTTIMCWQGAEVTWCCVADEWGGTAPPGKRNCSALGQQRLGGGLQAPHQLLLRRRLGVGAVVQPVLVVRVDALRAGQEGDAALRRHPRVPLVHVRRVHAGVGQQRQQHQARAGQARAQPVEQEGHALRRLVQGVVREKVVDAHQQHHHLWVYRGHLAALRQPPHEVGQLIAAHADGGGGAPAVGGREVAGVPRLEPLPLYVPGEGVAIQHQVVPGGRGVGLGHHAGVDALVLLAVGLPLPRPLRLRPALPLGAGRQRGGAHRARLLRAGGRACRHQPAAAAGLNIGEQHLHLHLHHSTSAGAGGSQKQ